MTKLFDINVTQGNYFHALHSQLSNFLWHFYPCCVTHVKQYMSVFILSKLKFQFQPSFTQVLVMYS